MIKYDNTGQFIVNSVKYTSKKSRAVSRCVFFFHHGSRNKKSAQLKYYRTDGRYLACMHWKDFRSHGKTLVLTSNSYVMFLDYRSYPGCFLGKITILPQSYLNPLKPKIQRALGSDWPEITAIHCRCCKQYKQSWRYRF